MPQAGPAPRRKRAGGPRFPINKFWQSFQSDFQRLRVLPIDPQWNFKSPYIFENFPNFS